MEATVLLLFSLYVIVFLKTISMVVASRWRPSLKKTPELLNQFKSMSGINYKWSLLSPPHPSL